jgi:uncharacterized protein (TIGR02996 family)
VGVEAELTDAIRAAPHDDAPRLVYADHLIAQGDPRGEFIATQIMRSLDTRDRWVELLRAHRDEWTRDARRIGASNVQFDRGFIERIDMSSLVQVLEHARELRTWAPVPAIYITSPAALATFAPDRDTIVVSTSNPRGVHFAVYNLGKLRVLDRLVECTASERIGLRYWFTTPRTLVVELGDKRKPVELVF